MRRFLCCILLIVSSTVQADERPNLVVLLCDDLGYGDLGCYGHPHIRTPNLDALAASGMRFTDFYSAAPVCSPSRVGLLTGRSPNLAGVYDWIPPAKATARRPDAREQVHMRREEITLPALLKKAGYATCMSGKWHCNSQFNKATQPQPGDAGFDHWFATQNNAAPSHENPKNFVRNGQEAGPLKGFSCQLVVDEAIGWLKNRANKEQPFFQYIAFHEPHEPVASPKDMVASYRDVAKKPDEAQYFANVENMDNAVGRFVAALDEMKLRKNTLIVFTSDNGPETLNRYRSANRSWGRPGPLKGMKLHTTDAGFRVAGIMNWLGTIPAGQVNSVPVSSLDFLPTFCALANATSFIPADRKLHGTDMRAAWKNESIARPIPLHWCYFNALNQARMAMRTGDFKVLARLKYRGKVLPKLTNVVDAQRPMLNDVELDDWEIYNVTKDIGESRNLFAPENSFESERKQLNSLFRSLLAESHVWTPKKAKQ